MQVRAILHLSGLLFLVLILTSCASLREPKTTPAQQQTQWEQNQAQLENLTEWRVTGRIGMVTPDDSGSASLRWDQYDQANYQWYLTGPFGRGALLLDGRPGLVTLKTGDEESSATNASVLLAEYTGWIVPVENLYYWIRGLPAPNIPYDFTLDNSGRLATLTQSGWTIEYSSYGRVQAYQLPRRLSLSAPDIEIKAAITRWSLAPPARRN